MACDTFIKIAQKCRKQFVTVQVGEVWPFIEEILGAISTHICDLQPQQVSAGGGTAQSTAGDVKLINCGGVSVHVVSCG